MHPHHQHRKCEVASPIPIYNVFCFYQEKILPLETAEFSSMYIWRVDLSGMTQCSNHILIKGCTIQKTTARNYEYSYQLLPVTVDPSSLLNKLLPFTVLTFMKLVYRETMVKLVGSDLIIHNFGNNSLTKLTDM